MTNRLLHFTLIALAAPMVAKADVGTARQLTAIDRAFESAQKTKNLEAYHAARARLEALVERLGSPSSDSTVPPYLRPCYAAAVRLETSRSQAWLMARTRPSQAEQRIATANREEYLAALDSCRADQPM